MAAVLGNNPFRINDWRVDPDLNRMSRGEQIIKVDPQNMKVLELLASRPGEVFSPAQIEESAWAGVIVSPNSVYQSIAQLRRALGDNVKEPKYIETISRKGYRCVARVEMVCRLKTSEVMTPEVPQPVAVAGRLTTLVSPQRSFRNMGLGGVTALMLLVVGAGVGGLLQKTTRTESGPVISRSEVSDEPPELTAEVALKTGDIALVAGRAYEAARHFQKALSLARDATHGLDDVLAARAMAKLADAYLWQARYKEAADLAASAVAIFEASSMPSDPRQVAPRNVLGEALIHLEKYKSAETQLQSALTLSKSLYGPFSTETESTKSTLVKLRCAEGRLREAEQLARELLASPIANSQQRMGRVLHRTLLAHALYDQHRYVETIEEARHALAEVEAVADPNHPYAASAHQMLANAHVRSGHYREAEFHARASYRIWKINQFEPRRLARAASTLGEVLVRQGQLNEGRDQLMFAARILQDGSGPWHRYAKRENDERLALLNAAFAQKQS